MTNNSTSDDSSTKQLTDKNKITDEFSTEQLDKLKKIAITRDIATLVNNFYKWIDESKLIYFNNSEVVNSLVRIHKRVIALAGDVLAPPDTMLTTLERYNFLYQLKVKPLISVILQKQFEIVFQSSQLLFTSKKTGNAIRQNASCETISTQIDTLCKNLTPEALLNLTERQMSTFLDLVNQIDAWCISSIGNYDIYRKFKKVIDQVLKPTIGYTPELYNQKVIIEINPLNASLEPTLNLDYTDAEGVPSKTGGFLFNNYNLSDFSLDETIYGYSGQLIVELPSSVLPLPSFYQCLESNTPFLLLITVSRFYLKPTGSASAQTEKSIVAIGSTKCIDIDNYSQPFGDDETKEVPSISARARVTINFYDPLQFFWKIHKPVYINFNADYEQILDENNYFSKFAVLDLSNCVSLKTEKNQLFINTTSSCFYDLFISILYDYGCYLTLSSGYTLDNSNFAITYLISDKPDNNQASKPFGTAMDYNNLTCNTLSYNNKFMSPLTFAKFNTSAPTSITLDSSEVLATDLFHFDGQQNYILEDNEQHNIYFSETRNDKSILKSNFANYTYKLSFSSWLYKNTPKLSYNLLSVGSSNIFRSTLKYSNNVYAIKSSYKLTKTILTNRYLAFRASASARLEQDYNYLDFKSDRSIITHQEEFDIEVVDGRSNYRYLPDFKRSNDIFVVGIVQSYSNGEGDNGDENSYTYRFFRKDNNQEIPISPTDISPANDSESLPFTKLQYKPEYPHYRVKISNLLTPSTVERQYVYVPVCAVTSNTNTFGQYKHGDLIQLIITDTENIYSVRPISNTATEQELPSECQHQYTQFGNSLDAAIGYKQSQEDSVFYLTQNIDNEMAISNDIICSKNKGISISYQSGDKEEN